MRARALWFAVLLDAFLSATWMEIFDARRWAPRSYADHGENHSGAKRGYILRTQQRSPPLTSHGSHDVTYAAWRGAILQHRQDLRWTLSEIDGCADVCRLTGLSYPSFRGAVERMCPENDGRGAP